jgi:hypothetical protein
MNFYIAKTAVKFNIPEAEAGNRLKDLIREHNKWVNPMSQGTAWKRFPDARELRPSAPLIGT